jgi:CRP-like cAMP-binding protein
LEDGRRQITTFLLPGDLCDVRMFILKRMDHSVSAVSHATVAQIPASDIMSLTEKHPRLARAFWWSSLVEEAINREWIVNLGQRPALERMAHLFCEIFVRLDGVGLTSENSCEIPLTQAELGEALGISTVHVNRTLMELRDSGLLSLEGRTLEIPDLNALKTAASFNENYLHLDREGQEFDANET